MQSGLPLLCSNYIIALLQQLADLCCVSHFAAVCTTFTLHRAVALLIEIINLIVLCVSADNVVFWLLLLRPLYNYYRIFHFSALAGEYSTILECCNQQD